MAQRRMFSKEITSSDNFVDMPISSQLLYFQLGMEADDEGFIGNARMLTRAYGAKSDDLAFLSAKGFIIVFQNGVSVVRDWNLNNKIRKDRIKPTIYSYEKSLLDIDSNGVYSILDNPEIAWQPNDNQVSTKRPHRLGKVSIGEDSIGKDRKYILSGTEVPDHIPYAEIVKYLNQKTNKKYKSSGAKTRRLIKLRANDGFTLDDFKKVIDNKVSEWGSNPDMEQYLRPETLFGTKFESYLNQKMSSNQEKQSELDRLAAQYGDF